MPLTEAEKVATIRAAWVFVISFVARSENEGEKIVGRSLASDLHQMLREMKEPSDADRG